MPFSAWTRKNSILKLKRGPQPPSKYFFQLRPSHIARSRLRRRVGLQARIGHRREPAAFHVDLRFLRPAFGGGLDQREDEQRLDQLVVALAHLDLAHVAVVFHAFERIGDRFRLGGLRLFYPRPQHFPHYLPPPLLKVPVPFRRLLPEIPS